jgi:hypothetical protein
MLYIFVLDNDPNSVSVLLLYFFVSTTTSHSFLLYQSYNIMLNVDPIYCYYSSTCIFLFSTFIPTILDLRLYIFVLNNNLPENILLMGYNKMLTFDQSNYFVRHACIFLFSTVIQILHHLRLCIIDVP